MPDDIGDHDVYMAGAVAIIGEYPEIIGEKLADPRTGTSVLGDFPTLSAIRKACEELVQPIEREYERQRAHKEHIAGALPRPKRTPEQQARIDEQVALARRQVGLPPTRLPPKPMQPLPLPEIDASRRRVLLADLAARKARNEAMAATGDALMTADDMATDL